MSELDTELKEIAERAGRSYYDAIDTFNSVESACEDVRRLLSLVTELRAEAQRAIAVLDLSSPYESVEDACRQRQQAYLTESGNVELLEAQVESLRAELAEKDARLIEHYETASAEITRQSDRANELETQLTEARAEIERLRKEKDKDDSLKGYSLSGNRY